MSRSRLGLLGENVARENDRFGPYCVLTENQNLGNLIQMLQPRLP
jgi:hypothetical protein